MTPSQRLTFLGSSDFLHSLIVHLDVIENSMICNVRAALMALDSKLLEV